MRKIILERLLYSSDSDDQKPFGGVFDDIPNKFKELFPEYRGDALGTALMWIFEMGLQIGFKTGRSFSEIEQYTDDLTDKYLDTVRKAIKDDLKLFKDKA